MHSERELDNYLRTHRQWAGFSQAEMAFLVGGQRGNMVSRYERGVRQPTLPTLFAYEVIFCAPARELFAGRYAAVAYQTVARMQTLARKLDTATPDRLTARKVQVLVAAIAESVSAADQAADETRP